MTINHRIKFTVQDYMNTPEDTRYELIAGELLVTPSPTPNHQLTVGELFALLREHVRRHDLGVVFMAPLDVVLSEHDVVQPDVLFISTERAAIISDRVGGAPDLVVGVLSPSTQERDRTLKRTLYARAGVPELWFIDIEVRQVEVLRLGPSGFVRTGAYGAADMIASPLFPDLHIQVAALFPQT